MIVLYLTMAMRSSTLVLGPWVSVARLSVIALAMLNCRPRREGMMLQTRCQGILTLSNSWRTSRMLRRGRVV